MFETLDGWWGGDGFRYKPIGAGTGKKIIPAARMGMGMGIALTDGHGDGNSNTRPAPPRLHPYLLPPISVKMVIWQMRLHLDILDIFIYIY